jgi:hypothetical protein
MDILVRIKRLVVSRRVLFAGKAEIEMLRKEGIDIFYVLISSKHSTDI